MKRYFLTPPPSPNENEAETAFSDVFTRIEMKRYFSIPRRMDLKRHILLFLPEPETTLPDFFHARE